MVNITLAVSAEMKQEMDGFPEINWSEVARSAIKERLEMLEKFKKFTAQSGISEKDTIRLGNKLKQKTSMRR